MRFIPKNQQHLLDDERRIAIHLMTENELKPRKNKFKYKELTICKYITKTFFIRVKSPID